MHRPQSMNHLAEGLKTRTKQFALEARTIGRQLLRSGTGVASNYRSACRARSRVEFAARLAVALEESDESGLWFELLMESGISPSARARPLLQEANELSAIFAASCIAARRRAE